MDASDVILKLQEHCHFPADWSNKVAEGVQIPSRTGKMQQ